MRIKPLKRVLDAFCLSKILDRASLIRFNSLITSPVVSIRARVHVRGGRSFKKFAFAVAGLVILASIGLNIAKPETTLAANASTINFQARLMSSSGAIVPDGPYNIEFKLYSSSSSSGSSQGSCSGDASCLWFEDYNYNGGSPDRRVIVQDGYVSVSLGSITSFPSTLNWNQPLYLGMNIGTGTTSIAWDGEMTPRMQLTAVPYAFAANSLVTQTGSYQSTLTWATQSTTNNLFLPNLGGSGGATLCVDGEGDGCGFGANYIQNTTSQQASSNFFISGTGQAATGFTAPQLQSASGNLTIQAASGTVTLGTSTNLTASGALTIAAGGSNTTLALNSNGTGSINIGANGSGSNSIQIGDSSGVYSQTINIGNNGTSGASTTLNIGSTAGGTLTLQDSGVTETHSGNTVTLKPNASPNNSLATFQVENNSSASIFDVDTSDGFVGIGTNAPASELNVSGTNLQPTAVSSGNGTAASNALTVTGATGGSTSAGSASGGAGAGISLQGGTGGGASTSSGIGGAGGSISILAGTGGSVSTGGTNGSGGSLTLKGGAAGAGSGTAGSSGSVIVESNGTNSTTAFEVQNASAVNVLDVDTSNGRVGIGAAPANGVLTVGTNTNIASGGIYFYTDTNLYRNASNSLQTDGALTVGGNFTDGTGSVDIKSTPGVTAGSSSNVFQIDGNSGTPADSFSFAANGDLGIGTTSPSANLSFNQAGATINVNQSTSGTGSTLTIQGGQGKAGGNYNGGNLLLQAGAGSGVNISGSVIVQSNGTNSTTAFEVQNAAGTSNLLIADTVNSKLGIDETPTSGGNALQVAGGATLSTGNLLIASGTETVGSGIVLSSTGIATVGTITGVTTYSGSSTLTLSGTNANELAITGAPLNSATSSLVQIGNVIATGSANGTYLGLNAPSGNTADLVNLEQAGTIELQLASSGAITTAASGGTINGQTISSSARFSGTLTVGSYVTGGTTLVCQNAGELATCSGSTGSYINNALTLQASANIYIQSVSASSATVQLRDISSQTADLLDFENSSTGAVLTSVNAAGDICILATCGSNTALSVSNGSSVIFSVNTSTNQALLGTDGSVAGGLVFYTTTSGNPITLQASSDSTGSGYKLTLPTAAPAAGLCLEAASNYTSINGNLTFSSCSNSATNISIVGETDNHGTISPVTTNTITTQNVGDLIVVDVNTGNSSPTGPSISSIATSGTGVISNWSRVGFLAGNSTVNRVEMWEGTVSTIGSTTITVTPSATLGNTDEITAMEYTASGINAGSTWSVDGKNTNVSSGSSTVTYPSITSQYQSELYVGYAQVQNTPATAGSTSGFQYVVTGESNLLTYNPSLSASTTYQPTGNQNSSGSASTIGAVFVADVASTAINNSTVKQLANFNVQASSAGSVAGVLQAANSGSGDILDLLNGDGSSLATFNSAGVNIASGNIYGNVYQNHVTNGSGTVTVPGAYYGYDLANTTNGGGTNAEVFNLTGLPSTPGTTAYITTTVSRSGGATSSVQVQINGTIMSTMTITASGTTTEYDDYIVMYSDGMWRIVGQGPETTANATYVQGADYAEWIDYSGTNAPQPGDVLSIDSTGSSSVVDSSVPYDSSLIGVVSTNPYQVGGNNDGHSVVLALAGRVPVKVSLENGPIKAGDPLTSSSTPGVAMKATGPGEIIGTALEGYDGTESSNEITVQLHVGYNNPNAQNGVIQGDQNVTGNLSVGGNETVDGDTTVQGNMNVAGSINVSGPSSINTLLVGNTLTDTGNLEVDGTAILGGLQTQTGDVSGNFSVAGNTSLASLLVSNGLSVNGNLSVSGTASIANLNVSGAIVTQNLTINGTLTFGGDVQLSGKVNTRQATIKTFTASVPITAGSAVIIDTTTGNQGNVTTTATPDDTKVIGVAVTAASQAGQPVQVAISGWVQVNVDTALINGAAPASITPGELIVTSSTPGTVAASSSPAVGSILGKSTDNQDTNNQVWILITLQ